MSGPRVLAVAGCLYLAVAIFTFGYAAAHFRCDESKHACVDDGTATGMAAAMLWPLYWSWELQS